MSVNKRNTVQKKEIMRWYEPVEREHEKEESESNHLAEANWEM